jgi:transposase
MPDLELFQQALGLEEPWEVVEVQFDAERRRLDLRVDFRRGARFACLECGAAGCKVHDTEPHTWRHLNFFQHEAYLTARVPRVICPEHGVKQVQVPWARERSDFTLLFEALVMVLAREMPVKAIGGLVSEHDTKIWRIVHYYVDLAVDAQDLSGTEELGIDDTSFRRGQDYVSVFCDLEPGERRAVFVCEGRDQQTVEEFAGFLKDHSGDPDRITEVCQDMSQAYLAGVREHLQHAEVTFDRYHVKQKLSQAVDTVRRAEAKEHKELLKGTRYLWLKRPDNLTVKQLDWLDQLLLQPLDTVRAWELALKFDDFYELRDPARAEELSVAEPASYAIGSIVSTRT